jgi:hypothetical protein
LAERGAFFLVAVDPLLRGVDVDEGEGLAPGQQAIVAGERGQEAPVRLVELADVAPG